MATRILMEWNYLSNSERGLPKDPSFEVWWHSTQSLEDVWKKILTDDGQVTMDGRTSDDGWKKSFDHNILQYNNYDPDQ